MPFGLQDCFPPKLQPDQVVEGRTRIAPPVGSRPPPDGLAFLVNGNPVTAVRDCLARTWWLCPRCGRRCKHIFLPEILCRICLGLRYADHRSMPIVHRVAQLRRQIGADPRPFAPLPKRQRHHVRFHRMVEGIRDEENKLVRQVARFADDLERRLRRR